MGSTIDRLDAALADKHAHPHGIVVKAYGIGRDEFNGNRVVEVI